jgi:hypothetical protein
MDGTVTAYFAYNFMSKSLQLQMDGILTAYLIQAFLITILYSKIAWM